MTRPRVVTFNLVSVDGRVTLAPGVNLMTGDERWEAVIKGIGDPYVWAWQTHDPQLLLEGSGSFLSPEHAELITPDVTVEGPLEGPLEGEHFLPSEIVDVPDRRWFAVLDGAGEVDVKFAEWPDPTWAGWHATVLTTRAASAQHLASLRGRGIPYLVLGDRHVPLGRALEVLSDRLGIRTVVCTGGGRLGGALLRLGLVDEVDVEILPWAIGGRGTPALFDAAPLAAGEWPTRLRLLHHEASGRPRAPAVRRRTGRRGLTGSRPPRRLADSPTRRLADSPTRRLPVQDPDPTAAMRTARLEWSPCSTPGPISSASCPGHPSRRSARSRPHRHPTPLALEQGRCACPGPARGAGAPNREEEEHPWSS